MASSSSQQLPLLHHQYIAMVHVYQRIFVGSMILPIAVVVIPIILRIGYSFLKLCIIGRSKQENHTADDVLVISSIITTMIFTHVFTNKFFYFQSYLHSLVKYNTGGEELNRSSLGGVSATTTNHIRSDTDDDGAHSKTKKVEDEMAKENSHNSNEKSDTSFQGSSSSKSPLKERSQQNTGSTQPTNDSATTTKNDTPSVHSQQKQKHSSLKSPKGMMNEQNHIPTETNPPIGSGSITATTTSSTSTTVYIAIFVFLFTCILTRYICSSDHHPYVTRILFPNRSRYQNSSRNLTDYLLPSFITTLRISVCMMIYSFMMALRFFGPASISTNPWDRIVKNLFHELRKLLIHHSYPTVSDAQGQEKHIRRISQRPGQQPQSINFDALPVGEGASYDGGRRYVRPTMYAAMQHIVISLMASMTVAYLGIFPSVTTATFSDNIYMYERSVHIASCIFTAFGSLIVILDGTSHEINPYLYTNSNQTKWFQSVCTNVISRVLYSTIIVPGTSMILAAYMMQYDVGLSVTNCLHLYFLLIRNCACMSMYLYMYDEAIRTSLFFPRPSVSKMIRQWSGDTSSSTVTQLGIILNSLLCDTSLVQQIVNVSYSMTRIGTYSFDKEELLSLEQHTKQMAHVLLSPLYNNAPSEAPLEEDVFRIVLLEAFGGGGDRRQPFSMSERHQRLICEWIDRPIKRCQSSKAMVKPLSSALVRGLCVFIAGSGEAFTILTSQTSSPSVGQSQLCRLSLATFCSIELCVVAISRCIVCSLTSVSGSILADWKCSHLSLQIPSALVAIYKLRCGLIQYSKIVNREDTSHHSDIAGSLFVGAHLVKEYGQVVRACDSAASLILQSMKSLQGLGRIDNTLLARDCQDWKDRLIDQFAEIDICK